MDLGYFNSHILISSKSSIHSYNVQKANIEILKQRKLFVLQSQISGSETATNSQQLEEVLNNTQVDTGNKAPNLIKTNK